MESFCNKFKYLGVDMKNDLFSFMDSLRLPHPKGILQVGASYGQEIKFFIEKKVENCIFIEPLIEPFTYISNICRNTPGFVAVNCLCSDYENQLVDFFVASNMGQSSSILAPKKHLDVFDYVKFDSVIKLKTTTVDHVVKLLEENGHASIVNSIDTLYMDVQGAEYKVLLGSLKTLKQIKFIYFEVIRGDLYENTSDLKDYMSLLESQGFLLNNINFNSEHHADALFVRSEILGL
jgi:FkbM family methyltransferase